MTNLLVPVVTAHVKMFGTHVAKCCLLLAMYLVHDPFPGVVYFDFWTIDDAG
jgi:hypothetical protein